MKTSHRLASQHKRQQLALHGNPVFKAIDRKVKSEAQREFESQLLTTRIKMLSAADGDDATDLLACLAVVIGTPCEAGARQFGRLPWVGQLHGALRTVRDMCLAGYRWDSRYALALDRAVEIAGEPRHDLDATTFTEAFVSANHMANLIWAHEVSPETVQ